MNRSSLSQVVAAHDAPQDQLPPVPPETGRNGESPPRPDVDASPQTVASPELASTTPDDKSTNFHHLPEGAGDTDNEADSPLENQPIDEEYSDDVEDWDDVLSFVAEAATVEAARQDQPQAVKAADDAPSRVRRSRTQKLTDSEEDRLLLCLSLGMSLRQAAARIGCHHSTLVKRAQRDEEFAQAVSDAKSKATSEPLLSVYHASARSWRAAAWLLGYLERRENRGRAKGDTAKTNARSA